MAAEIGEVFTDLIERLIQHDIETSVPIDEDFFLSYGLGFFSFDERRLSKVDRKTNEGRFKTYFGIPPCTAIRVYEDLKRETNVKPVYFLMTLHWFTKYGTEKELSGPWGFCEDHLREKCKEYAKHIQSLKKKKIVFGGFDDEEIHWISVDTVNFLSQVSQWMEGNGLNAYDISDILILSTRSFD